MTQNAWLFTLHHQSPKSQDLLTLAMKNAFWCLQTSVFTFLFRFIVIFCKTDPGKARSNSCLLFVYLNFVMKIDTKVLLG